MKTPDPHPTHDRPDEALPAPLATALHALRVDAAPGRDLWPGIAARLPPRAAAGPGPASPAPPRPAMADGARAWTRRTRIGRRNAGYAVAAAVVLAAGIGWQLWPARVPVPALPPGDIVVVDAGAPTDAPLLVAADALAREYQGALREIQAATGTGAAPTALEAELDRRAAEVRAALARDPDALHLFHHLQRIYAHRLALDLRQA